MKPYSLSLYSGVLDAGQTFVTSLTHAAADWRRSIAAIGGYAEGVLSLSGDVQGAFDGWLGYHLVERCGGTTTWEGMITELELEIAGMRRIRSLELMANAVRATYIALTWQPGGGFVWQTRWTTWATNSHSIGTYGRREQVLQLDACPKATAEAKRDTTLSTYAYPWTRPQGVPELQWSGRAIGSERSESRSASGVGTPAPTRLIVRAAGYGATAGWMFAQEGDNLDHDVSHWIAAIVGSAFSLSANHGGSAAGAGDCQFLRSGVIDRNTLQVTECTTTPQRAGDLLYSLAALGDSTGYPWSLEVDTGRLVHYRPVDRTPRYYLKGAQVFDNLTAHTPAPPWTLRPAVMRDMSYRPAVRSEPGSFLDDPRDIYVEEVEVAASGGVSLRTSLFDQSDLLANQFDYLEPWTPRWRRR